MVLRFVIDMNSSLDGKHCRSSSASLVQIRLLLLVNQSIIVMHMIFILLMNSPMNKNIFQFSGCYHY